MTNASQEKNQPHKTVLVADDSPQIRALVRQVFLADGFTLCVEAVDGAEALEVAARCKPDVIVLDLSMPVMNGLVAAPKLKSMFPDIPIILFSLYSDQIKKQNLHFLGISATVSKAEPIDQLLTKAHELMEHVEPTPRR